MNSKKVFEGNSVDAVSLPKGVSFVSPIKETHYYLLKNVIRGDFFIDLNNCDPFLHRNRSEVFFLKNAFGVVIATHYPFLSYHDYQFNSYSLLPKFLHESLSTHKFAIAVDTSTGRLNVGELHEFKNPKFKVAPTRKFAVDFVNLPPITYAQRVHPKTKTTVKKQNFTLRIPNFDVGKRTEFGYGKMILRSMDHKNLWFVFIDVPEDNVVTFHDLLKKLQGHDPYIEAFMLDNGSYEIPLIKKNRRIIRDDLITWDAMNSRNQGGGALIMLYR